MTKIFLLLYFLLMAAPVFAGSPLELTLPGTGDYSYWIQSKEGTVGRLPINLLRKKNVRIPSPLGTGDFLFVLDAHTGWIAARPVSVGLDNVPDPIKLMLTDFKPLDSFLSTPDPPVKASVATAPTLADEPAGSGIGRLVTVLLSLILGLGVLWIVFQLIKTRFEPLLHLARRAGVGVPNPTPLEADDVEATIIYTPVRRTPESIPETAGLPAAGSHVHRGPGIMLPGVSALVGLQGIVAGSTFALTSGDVTIGRDGGNEIVLAENTVSRQHAQVRRDEKGLFTLTDLGSANGVYVNGMRVQRAILNGGDEIKIGDNYFRFQADKELS